MTNRKKAIKEIKAKRKIKKGKACVYCNCNNSMILTVDHITPKARGGTDENSNKQVTCYICNYLKGALKHNEFKQYLSALKVQHHLCKIKLDVSYKLKFSPNFFPRDFIKEETKEVQK